MQSQVRGDLPGPKSQLCWKEGLGSLEEKRDRLGVGGVSSQALQIGRAHV